MNYKVEKVKKSFSVQAENFENGNMNFSKQEYLDYIIEKIGAKKTDRVLEIAAGTCVCGRSLASSVAYVTCLDATPEMLVMGKKAAEDKKIANISFVEGIAEQLPFDDGVFDIVMNRLSFHHFTEMRKPFKEMNRVLKAGGKLVVIDREATKNELREIEDYIETLRDNSHIKNCSKDEFLSLYKEYGYKMLVTESTLIPVKLSAWMNLTKTQTEMKHKITLQMENEIAGLEQTGFFPYRKNNKICFDQRWLMMIGKKE